MSDYVNVPSINALFDEQAIISQAVLILEDAGTILNFRVGSTEQSTQEAAGVTVATGTPSPELLDTAYSQLITRYNAINRELEAFGIINVPPDLVDAALGTASETTPATEETSDERTPAD